MEENKKGDKEKVNRFMLIVYVVFIICFLVFLIGIIAITAHNYNNIEKLKEAVSTTHSLGTIVKTKQAGEEQDIMIVGRFQMSEETLKSLDDEVDGGFNVKKADWDYVGVPYPNGYCGSKYTYLFNEEDITEVVYERNFSNDEIEFLRYVKGLSDGSINSNVTFKEYSNGDYKEDVTEEESQ